MSNFVVCTKCKHLELEAHALVRPGSVLCTLCNPAIGYWHGIFERTRYNPSEHKELVNTNPSDTLNLG